MSIRKIISSVNESIQPILEKWPGSKLYGVCESVIRKSGTVEELLPGETGNDGEIKYVGIDDTAPLIAYHKIASISSSIVPGGVGDSQGDIRNSYTLSLIVYFDRKKTGYTPEELLLFFQAVMNGNITEENYKLITARVSSVIINSRVVFEEEYRGIDFKLPVEKSLFKITYLIESTHSAKCFNKCP